MGNKGKIKINGLTKATLTVLTIGTILCGTKAYDNSKPKRVELTEPIRGCDMSEFQVYTNWEEIEKNFDYVILRASSGLANDEKFEENYKNAYKHKMNIGIYTMNAKSTFNTSSLEEFKKASEERFNHLIELLKDKDIKYPIYLDIEFKNPVRDALPKEYAETLLETFENKMKDNGYIPGIYSNKSTYDYLESNVENMNSRFEIWVAGGDSYDKVTSIEKLNSDNKILSDENIKMVQSYQYAVNSGAGDALGHLDIDYSLVDYNKQNIDYKGIGLTAALATIDLAGIYVLTKKK